MTDRKFTCVACKSAVTKDDIEQSDLEFDGVLKATNQPEYTADADVDLVATVGTLDEYVPMVRTSGNQSISGIKNFVNTLLGDAVGVPIGRTLGYYKTHKLVNVSATESGTWYLNVIYAWRYGMTLVHYEISFTAGVITSISSNDLLNRTQTGASKIAVDIIDGVAYLVVDRTSQSNVYSRITIIDLQINTTTHPSWSRFENGEFYTPTGTLIEANLI